MDVPHHVKHSFHRLRNRRIAKRHTLSLTLRQSYDTSLAQILFHIPSTTCLPTRAVIRLLDKGATASLLDPHELKGPNLGDLVDAFDRFNTLVKPHLLFTLLDHIIASPCHSWATNRRYVGNGGLALPYFLMSAVVTGHIWGWGYNNPDGQLSTCHRFRAWCTLRNMIWAYEDDLTSAMQHPKNGFEARICSEFLVQVSIAEIYCTFNDVERRLLDNVVNFFNARSTLALSEGLHTRCFAPLRPFAIELLIRIDSQLLEKYLECYTIEQVFNTFFMSKPARRRTLKLLSYPEFRAWILTEDCVRELCRRKERIIFEELYVRDPNGLMKVIPFALSVIESNFVRGCKQRLIEFLNEILARRVGNEETGRMTSG